MLGSHPFRPRPALGEPPGSMFILLIEDNRTVRAALQLILARLGHSVLIAESLRSARAAVDAQSFDLVISDAQLGDGDGIAFLGELRARRALPTILISADPPGEAGRAAFDAYLSKPVLTADLRDAIDRVTGQISGT